MTRRKGMLVYFDHYEHPSTRARKKEIRYHRRYLRADAITKEMLPSYYKIWTKGRIELRNESIKTIKRLGKKG